MTVHPGFGGQSSWPEVLPKIERVRSELDRRGLSAELEVDGGIDEKTAPLVVSAGATVLVCRIGGVRSRKRLGSRASDQGSRSTACPEPTAGSRVDRSLQMSRLVRRARLSEYRITGWCRG